MRGDAVIALDAGMRQKLFFYTQEVLYVSLSTCAARWFAFQ
jgi:hypothetical protein